MQEPIPERATPILGLCHGVFRHILEHSRENGICATSYECIRIIRYQKEKVTLLKANIIIFRSVGFADRFVGLKRYSKFASKPF